jgi:hypothetical protein
MVSLEIAQDFPASLARLWEVLGRRDYVERKYAALGSTALRIRQFDSSAQRIEVRLERTLGVDASGLPAWARWLSGRPQRLTHHTRWTRVGPKQVDIELRVSTRGHAVDAHATGSVTELDSGLTRMRLRVAVQCSIPAIGGRIAELFVDQMKHSLEQDHSYTVRYLTGGTAAPADASTRSVGARRRSRTPQ